VTSQRRPSARLALRTATEAVHSRLHLHPGFAAIAAGRATRDGYRSLLARLYGFHAPLEARLLRTPWGDAASAPEARYRRVRLLEQDLLDLGLEAADIDALPCAPDTTLPVLDSPGRFLGCLYVREGSTLGGHVLARALDGLLGDGVRGRRFLAGGAEAAAAWRSCCAALEAAGEAGHLPHMVAGAAETFASLEAWLDTGRGQEVEDAAVAPVIRKALAAANDSTRTAQQA
jgi:heme oxygenase (biliverdin-IX-beta and delta-forming)